LLNRTKETGCSKNYFAWKRRFDEKKRIENFK